MALGQHTMVPGLNHHSERGGQYASQAFQNLLQHHRIECSMSGSGDCFDYGVAEGFFAHCKGNAFTVDSPRLGPKLNRICSITLSFTINASVGIQRLVK